MSIVEDYLDVLCDLVPARRPQIELLLTLFGQREHYVVPGVFVYGHTTTGKSLVVRTILEQLQMPHVVVNCVECYSTRLIYEQILNALSNTTPGPANEYANYARCDNMNDFVRLLKQVVDQEKLDQETVYMVFERAERLRDQDANVLPALLRLQQLSGLNVCVILETEIVFEKFRSGTGFLEPYIVHFPDYSKDELLEVLALDAPAEYPVELYKGYVSLVLGVFHLACRSLGEIRHLALLNFPKYVEPIQKGEVTVEDTHKLWRNIEPHLKKALQTVYLREVSSAQWEKMQEQSINEGTLISLQGAASRHNIELPFYSKYLLIAAYLASYNPAKSDKRFFAKNAGRINKRVQLAIQKKSDRTTSQLLGPKPFPLDRLMAIFYSILEGRVAPTANIFSQVTSLVTLGLMAQVAGSDSIDSPKYKCLVSLDFMKGVARSINFEIIKYLFDFAG